MDRAGEPLTMDPILELVSEFRCVNPFKLKPIRGWSDEVLCKLRSELSFPHSAYVRSNLRNILCRFYDFYFTGTINGEDNLVATVFDAIAIAKTKEGQIWNTPDTHEQGFYKLNRSEITQLTKIAGKSKQANSKNIRDNATPFETQVSMILSNLGTTGDLTIIQEDLVRVTSFLALTLMRSATQSAVQMRHAFDSLKYKEYLESIALWPGGWPWSPPCTRCLNLCENSLCKRYKTTSQLFIILVHEEVLSNNANYPNKAVKAFLAESVLNATAWNGLGILKMITEVSRITGLCWEDLRKMSTMNVTIDSWKSIAVFYKQYCTIGREQYGYRWARIINDGYLMQMTPKYHVHLATVLASIMEEEQGPGVWNAAWAKNTSKKHSEDVKSLGKAIFSHAKHNLE